MVWGQEIGLGQEFGLRPEGLVWSHGLKSALGAWFGAWGLDQGLRAWFGTQELVSGPKELGLGPGAWFGA